MRAFDDNAGAPELTTPHRLIVFSVFSQESSQVDCFFVSSRVDHASQVGFVFLFFPESTVPHRLIVFSVFSRESSRVIVMMPVSECSQVCAFDDNAGALELTVPHSLIVFPVFSQESSQVDCFFCFFMESIAYRGILVKYTYLHS